jgi:hypothetical protein
MTERWTEECEELLAEWSEKASCYRWLHGRCEKKYKRKYYRFSIPVIILSTLTGAANVGMDSFVSAENKAVASAIVGGVNIFAGILSTLQNFLKVAELMEAHRSSGVAWSKLGRNIAIELALDHQKRSIQNDFLKISRAEYDRLIESSPMIDDDIIEQFKHKFKNYNISVPAICNGFGKCDIYRLDDAVQRHKDDFFDGINDLVSNEEREVIDRLKDKINNKEIYQKMNNEVEMRVSKEIEKRIGKELDKKVNEELKKKTIKKSSKTVKQVSNNTLKKKATQKNDLPKENLDKKNLDEETEQEAVIENEEAVVEDEVVENEEELIENIVEDEETGFLNGIEDNP